MKTLNENMALPYKMEIVEDKEEGGFIVSFPDLPGCITCGETVESSRECNGRKESLAGSGTGRGTYFMNQIS